MIVDRPIVFGAAPALFGVLTLPENVREPGVVICPPFGHPNICSYRPLRTLARRIGARGWPVVRFDWPGSGDSGDPVDPVASWTRVWTDAVLQAAHTVRSVTGVEEVALVGLRIGGTLAFVAAEEDAGVTGVGLLAPHATGRAYLRESRAFQALAESRSSQPEVVPPPLPEGSMESSGFLVTREEIEALEAIDLLTREPASFRSRRVLIVTPSPERQTDALAERLREAGADVAGQVEPELARAWDGTATSVMPASCSEVVCRWLDTAGPPRRRPRGGLPSASALDAGGCRELPLVLDTARGRRVGVVCEPNGPVRRRGDWVVFLNAGRVRRSGPNRLVTSYARAWARRGLPSLRLDVGGTGDSDGDLRDDEISSPYDAGWYEKPSFTEDVADALAWLSAERDARRFDLVGLCSGAEWGYHAAIADERVAGVALINPRALYADGRVGPLSAWRQARELVRHPRSLGALRGHGLRSLPLAALRGAALTVAGRGDLGWQRGLILEAMAELRERGTLLSIVFSDGDLGIDYFERHLGLDYAAVLERHGMIVEVVRGPDHTFRPLWSQAVLRRSLERHLAAIAFLDHPEPDAA
jgi:pimeloyl-ACP methyl ester carboxylesterase